MKYTSSKMTTIPDKATIQEAHDRIRPYIHKTPVLTNSSINEISGSQLFFKCENFQKIGAFKIRGAINTVFSLSDEELKNGVATHSSGNHAQALAYAARQKKIPAYIVMPKNAPAVKVAAVKGYGAEIFFCEPSQEARETMIKEVIENTGATFIHPFDDYRIIAGQATAAIELFEQTPSLDFVITPVGGGGLLSGTALATKYFSPETTVLAGEPLGADDTYQSMKAGKIVPNESVSTIADGLLTNVGVRNFEIIKNEVKEIICVSDSEIIEAMKLLWERMKIVIEPSGAVPLAAILKSKETFHGKKVGVILSGGNVDLGKLPF